MATSERMRPTLAQTMPAMAMPPPFHSSGLLRILPIAMMPSTSAAMAIGELANQQQQPGMDRMPRIIDTMASGFTRGPPPNPGGGGPKPPGGGPYPGGPPGGGPYPGGPPIGGP